MRGRLTLAIITTAMVVGVATTAVALTTASPSAAVDNESCRPDGVYRTPGVDVPYCLIYDSAGREMMGSDHPRRNIGYFTAWRHGKNNQPSYLVKDIPWTKVSHINYAFAHVGGDNRISVGGNVSTNPAIGMDWPGVPGAELDPNLPYRGHFNLLTKYKRQHPNVKTLISIGGWAETGGYFDDGGNRVASGGFYTMAESQASVDTFADSVVAFLRQYGFNGADIDYEYATSANYAGNPLDFQFAQSRRATLVAGYVRLMKTLREKLDAASAADGKYYMLTAAVSASGWLLRGVETYQVTQYLDYANIMTYDLHGAWNHFVGPNAALYDDGADNELVHWNVYGTYGLGYLNTDWASHYFRGAMPPGRINIGLPFYTRGWQRVTGGTNGLWGKAALPDQAQCPPGTGSSVGSTVPCGDGALGIDNLWHDTNASGSEEASGTNPMWHAKNLENAKPGTSYAQAYGLDPVNDPADRLTGTYARNYSSTMAAPWLWNNDKRVFLSTEDEASINTKADYVVSKGLGGVMFWEMAGDYSYYPDRNNGQGEYFMGSTLVTALYERLRNAAPYGNLKTTRTMPSTTLDVGIEVYGFAVGDANYPINPKLKITNRTANAIPGGAVLEFDHGTSAQATMTQQSGWTLSYAEIGHSGNNVGGLRGDFQRVRLTVPSFEPIPAGGSKEVTIRYDLPIATPSNFTLSFGGNSYRLSADYPRGGISPTTSPTSAPTASPTSSPTVSPTSSPPGGCTAPQWNASTIYTGGAMVSWQGRKYSAKWWTQNEQPDLNTGDGKPWRDDGPCTGSPSPSPTVSPTSSPTPSPTRSEERTSEIQ
ncbi:MAG TPA: chitinase [Micromonosporaceae bacterium]|nr:chitinase [Micromonosporaceae bacterium]